MTKLKYIGEIEATPEHLAELFSAMGDNEQARFFSHVESLFSEFVHPGMQECYIANRLDKAGSNLVYRIASFRKARGLGTYHATWALNSYPEEF